MEYTRDHLVGHVEANKGAVTTAKDHGRFKKQFDEWLTITGRWKEAGALIEKIRKQRDRDKLSGFICWMNTDTTGSERNK